MSKHHKTVTRSERARPLTPAKKKVFMFVTFLFPVVATLALESGLRIFHYGPELSLFTTEEIGRATYHVMNPEVKNRYFSHVAFTPNTSTDYFRVPKPQNIFRIFCLGGSTTVGFPYGYVGSFSSFLRDRLHAALPQRNIEIINLGMTATNSFTVNDIVHELVDYEPDLIIVYDGHNEFYGALGAASRESFGASRWLTKLYLKCVHIKTFLLLRSGIIKLSGMFSSSSEKSAAGTMMEQLARDSYIPLNSSLYQTCLNNFRANIEELAATCRSQNIPLILSTQVSNLRDLAPFVSRPAGYAKDREQEFKKLLARGKVLLDADSAESALRVFESASAMDSERADVRYAVARCLDRLNMKQAARRAYVAARDYDQLRFRASSDFNDAIRALENFSQTMVADIEKGFERASADSLIGNDLILEHLHPNLRGNFMIAKLLADLIRQHQLIAPGQVWDPTGKISDDSLWHRRPTTELDELAAKRRISILTSAWPFQPGAASLSGGTRDTIGIIVDRLTKAKTTWEEAHVSAAEYYTRTGDTLRAEREYRTLVNQLPMNVSAYLFLGQLYLRSGRSRQAAEIFQTSLNADTTVLACRAIGSIKFNAGYPAEAVPWFTRAYARSSEPEELMQNGYLLSLALHTANMNHRASAVMQELLQKFPNFKPGKALMRKITSAEKIN